MKFQLNWIKLFSMPSTIIMVLFIVMILEFEINNIFKYIKEN